ncbi:MAG: hypothetical protein WBL63_11605, partial [Candidatus Acidiferrum sp.]
MNQKLILKSMVILGFAGFFSALLAICALPKSKGILGELLPGVLFGTALSVCLWLRKILDASWKMLAMTAASSATLPIAALVCVGLEYSSPFTPVHDSAKGFSEVSSVALFAGGTVGAFLVLTTV